LARVYFREGRLDDAAAALERASRAEVPPAPWVASWLTGLINKQNGFLDQAIADFERVLATGFPEAHRRGFDFSKDYRVVAELGQTLVERAKQERGPARRTQRDALLEQAESRFLAVLALDPENVSAHYNLALIYRLQGNAQAAEQHAHLHGKYRPDDNAGDTVIALHRSRNPAADHAAEAVAIYDLQRPGAFGLTPDEQAGPVAVAQDVSQTAGNKAQLPFGQQRRRGTAIAEQ
jgi:tetratricopeptide (TPR) repeat protein